MFFDELCFSQNLSIVSSFVYTTTEIACVTMTRDFDLTSAHRMKWPPKLSANRLASMVRDLL